MKLTIKWLKQWVDTKLSDAELVKQLTMAGLEVDALLPISGDFSNVVVGKIITCKQHPNADKLKVCQVDTGKSQTKQIICGAANARVNLMVAVAEIGAQLPEFTIKKAKLRGIESFGMLCSASELGLNQELFIDNGIVELAQNLTLGQDIRAALCLDDKILALDITPNRGDCFSVKGVAQEVAIFESLPLKNIEANVNITTDLVKNTQVLAAKSCPRYLTRIIKNIDNTLATPQWMAEKLVYSGQKLNSLVVDVTNYVLLELGQPLHAFDLDKITGKIVVRMAKEAESITLLNEQILTLNPETLVIADDSSILAIAGIMGGLASSSTQKTRHILLESAFFEPVLIAGKARDYGLHTESSLRFERGVDFNGQELAINRATELIIEIAGGSAGVINEVVSDEQLPKLKPIHLRKKTLDSILGFELDEAWIEKQFKALNFTIHKIDSGNFWIIPPSFRFDIVIEADLIEELARIYGYDKLPSKALSFKTNIKFDRHIAITELTQILLNKGYDEAICYSFISQTWHQRLYKNTKALNLSNPISKDLSIMRPSLLAGLLQTILDNKRYGYDNNRFFETGLCFQGLDSNEQIEKISAIISGNRFTTQWSQSSRAVDFYDIKAEVESLLSLSGLPYEFNPCTNNQDNIKHILHPNKSANIILNGQNIGYVGALSPVLEAELCLENVYLFEMILLPLRQKNVVKYQSFSNKQTISRDLSIVIDDNISFESVKKNILLLQQDWLIKLKLLDVYKGQHIEVGKKSLLLGLIYQADTAVIDKQIDEKVGQVLNQLIVKFNAVQR